MGAADQKQFTDAVAKAKANSSVGFFTDNRLNDDWVAALHACNRLAMFDMLQALNAIDEWSRGWLIAVEANRSAIGGGVKRIQFANTVIDGREIADFGIPDEQVNDGREFLGCTRLDDDGVRSVINDAMSRSGGRPGEACCGVAKGAWLDVLVPRRQRPGGSLTSNVAAAAHYMLARYHVCAAKAYPWQMKTIIDGYDERKRGLIANGDKDLKKVALTGNRPFPPDFAIRKWGYKGADEGEADRVRCNSGASHAILPDVNGEEY